MWGVGPRLGVGGYASAGGQGPTIETPTQLRPGALTLTTPVWKSQAQPVQLDCCRWSLAARQSTSSLGPQGLLTERHACYEVQ